MRAIKPAQWFAFLEGVALLVGSLVIVDLTNAGGAGLALAIILVGPVIGILVARTLPLR